MGRPLLACGLALALAGCESELMSADDIDQPIGVSTGRVTYGDHPSQFIERWHPRSRGRGNPPVVLIHGGCWRSQYDLGLMNSMADALKQQGYSVWNVEYRRLGEPGGGYPGTFQDIATAIDLVHRQSEAPDRLVVIGHSAGGHLALWASGRASLPEDSPLRSDDPAPILGVLSIGGVGDLKAAAADPTFSGACGKNTIEELVGAGRRQGDPYADTNPVQLPAPGTRQILMHGAREQITPAALGEAYAQAVSQAGGVAEAVTVSGAGHFELITPDATGWNRLIDRLDRLSRGLS